MLSSPRHPVAIRAYGALQPLLTQPTTSFQADFHHDASRSYPYGQRDPWPFDGCRREGEIRPSRPANGRRRYRHGAVHAVPEIRCRRAELAGPRPFRALGRPRLDAALLVALSHRQQGHDARPAEAFPPARIADAGPSGKLPHQGHRNHDRAARPGHRDLGRHGGCGENACRGVRQEDRQSPHLRARLRWRPDGRRLAGSDCARRSLEAQQADRAVRRQRHLDRRPDLALRLGGSGQAIQVRGLGSRTDRRPGSESDRGCDHPRAEIQQAHADRLQDHDRLRRADQGRHLESPRRSARRR